jgi:hypothetical protein
MPKALIRMAYKQVIGIESQTPFEQQVFNASFAEFRLQRQSFSKGQDLFTWSAIRAKFPKSNPALPFKLSFSIAGLVAGLNGQIPGLQDTLALKNIPFVNHRFELIESDSNDRSAHRIAIIYLTESLTLFEIIGELLLVALPGSTQTFLLKPSPDLSIFNYTELSGTYSPAVERKSFFTGGL